MQCQATTKKGHRCPNGDATPYINEWLCHIHNPNALFRKQVAANKATKQRRKADANIRQFERLAEQFRRETGFTAPGKSVPLAAPENEDERRAAWQRWIQRA